MRLRTAPPITVASLTCSVRTVVNPTSTPSPHYYDLIKEQHRSNPHLARHYQGIEEGSKETVVTKRLQSGAAATTDSDIGPPATRNGAPVPFGIPFPYHQAPEQFFFLDSPEGGSASSRGAPTGGGSSHYFNNSRRSLFDAEEGEGRGAANRYSASQKSQPFCKLCNQTIDTQQSKKGHFVEAFTTTPTGHVCREMILKVCTFLLLRGFPISSPGESPTTDGDGSSSSSAAAPFTVEQIFADVLCQKAIETGEYLPSLSGIYGPRGTPSPLSSSSVVTVTPLEDRAEHLLRLLLFLVRTKMIDLSLAYRGDDTTSEGRGNRFMDDELRVGSFSSTSDTVIRRLKNTPHHLLPQAIRQRRRVHFERLEYIGDTLWGNFLMKRIALLLPHERFPYSQNAFGFNTFKNSLEMNLNLEFFFDFLGLQHVLHCYGSTAWWRSQRDYFLGTEGGEGNSSGKDSVKRSQGPITQVARKTPSSSSSSHPYGGTDDEDDASSSGLSGSMEVKKVKADVVEGILGELHIRLFHLEECNECTPQLMNDCTHFLKLFSQSPPDRSLKGDGGVENEEPHVQLKQQLLSNPPLLASVLRHCLTEFYDLIVLHYFHTVLPPILPLAEEIAAAVLWEGGRDGCQLPLRSYKQFNPHRSTRFARRLDFSTSSLSAGETEKKKQDTPESLVAALLRGKVHSLPPLPKLFPTPVSRSCCPPHGLDPFLTEEAKKGTKLETIETLFPMTFNSFSKTDCFARYERSYRRLGIPSVGSLGASRGRRICPAYDVLRYTLVPLLYQEEVLLAPHRTGGEGGEEGEMESMAALFPHLHSPEEIARQTFFRDGFYQLQSTPQRRQSSSKESSKPSLRELLEVGVRGAPLSKEKETSDLLDGTDGSSSSYKAIIYSPSRYVMPHVLPTAADGFVRHTSAVVTDRQYYKGVYGYLGAAALHHLPSADTGVSSDAETGEKQKASTDTLSNVYFNKEDKTQFDPYAILKLQEEVTTVPEETEKKDEEDEEEEKRKKKEKELLKVIDLWKKEHLKLLYSSSKCREYFE